MKKTLALLLASFSLSLLYSQEFIGQKMKFDQWQTNEVLAFTSIDGSQEIQVVALPKKVKRNNKRIRHLKINGDKYQLVATSGVINFLDAGGNKLLKTNIDRSEVFVGDKEKFVKNGNLRSVEYLDETGQIAVRGMIINGLIRIKNYREELNKPLIALCLEELLRLKMERDQADQTFVTYLLINS